MSFPVDQSESLSLEEELEDAPSTPTAAEAVFLPRFLDILDIPVVSEYVSDLSGKVRGLTTSGTL